MEISPWTILVLAVLLSCSAACSGLETAFFSLSPTERRRAGPAAERLMADPRGLLVTLLAANLALNTLFFLFAAGVELWSGPWAEVASGLGALVGVVLFAEVLPKSLALHARLPVARASARPLGLVVAALRPLRLGADRLLRVIYRALGELAREERAVTAEALAQVLDHSARQGTLLASEAEILSGLFDLAQVRVREIMTPRVDLPILDLAGADRARPIRRAVEAKEPCLIVVDRHPDQILGRVRLRDLLADPGADPRTLLQPVRFVPEVATALAALEVLRREGVAQAVVVDEWGGTAGLLKVEQVLEEVVGDLPVEGERTDPMVVPLGGGSFRVDGALSVRDWNELFGFRIVPVEFETVGGLVTALLGRIPREGDQARSGGLVFRVLEVRRRRIRSLEVSTLGPAEEGAP